MSVTIGSWGIPALITMVAFGLLAIDSIRSPAPGGYGDIGNGIVGMFYAAVAAIVSLVAWLIWAVLT